MVWATLKQVCETDHLTAVVLMEAAGITTDNGSIELCYDSTGASYEIPIPCINVPLNFGTDFLMEKLHNFEKP